jgi:MFS family permease
MRRFVHVTELRALLALNFVVACATGYVLVNSAVIVRESLGRTDADVAILLAAYGAGSMIVALLLPRVLRRVGDRSVMLRASVLVAPLLAGVFLTLTQLDDLAEWVSLLVIWSLLGAATSAILTPSGRLLRRAAPDAERPAVFAAQFSLSHLCFLVTYPLAGWLGAVATPAISVAWLSALALAASVVAWYLWRATALRQDADLVGTPLA